MKPNTGCRYIQRTFFWWVEDGSLLYQVLNWKENYIEQLFPEGCSDSHMLIQKTSYRVKYFMGDHTNNWWVLLWYDNCTLKEIFSQMKIMHQSWIMVTLKFHGIHVLVVTLVLKMLCQCTIDLEYSITYYNFTMFRIYSCTSDSEYCVSLF